MAAIESRVGEIGALKLTGDDQPKIAQDAQAFHTLTAFARQFIAAGPHTNAEMLTQVDGAVSSWRSGRAPVDEFIKSEIKGGQAVIDAANATSTTIEIFTLTLTLLFLSTLAFYQFYLTLRPLNNLAKLPTLLSAAHPITLEPTRRRDELGQLT